MLIDTDPLLASPSEIRATKVEETWVGGRPVYKRSTPKSNTSETEKGQ